MIQDPSTSFKIPKSATKTQGKDDTASLHTANKEALAFQKGSDLEFEAEKNQHGRRESARDIISKALHWWIIVVAILVIAATLVMAYHILLPASIHWLAPSDISAIKDSLTGVTVGLFFGFMAKSKFV